MNRIVLIGAVGAVFLLMGCGDSAPEPDPDNPQYKLGYEAGQNDEHAQLCGQIEDYKDSMAEALKEADICPN